MGQTVAGDASKMAQRLPMDEARPQTQLLRFKVGGSEGQRGPFMAGATRFGGPNNDRVPAGHCCGPSLSGGQQAGRLGSDCTGPISAGWPGARGLCLRARRLSLCVCVRAAADYDDAGPPLMGFRWVQFTLGAPVCVCVRA